MQQVRNQDGGGFYAEPGNGGKPAEEGRYPARRAETGRMGLVTMDRETAIRGLFEMGCTIGNELGFEQAKPVLQFFDEVIELLKEQKAVKPKSKSRKGEYPQIVHRCGNCNEILYRYYKYCPTCGRQVKWE